MGGELRPRSLVWATDIDVLPADRTVERREDHLVVRSPGNPLHWWGNFLIFDGPPRSGDGERWEAAFADAFAAAPQVRHRTFAWDTTDGGEGEAHQEFLARDYTRERMAGLIATPAQITPHPRASRQVEVRALDPTGDGELWEQVIDLGRAVNEVEPSPDPDFISFVRRRQEERRAMLAAGGGAWYVALHPAAGQVVASCGIVATGPRGRFQAVETHPSHQRQGICRRLVAEAAVDAADRHDLHRLVIAADPDYHALGLYESLGFRLRERSCGVCRRAPG